MSTRQLKKILPSHEPCVEAGWKAWDLYLSSPTDKEWVLSLRDLGSLTFLSQLRKPFFKVESHHYIIKGILGEDYIRIAMAGSEELSQKTVETMFNINNFMTIE